MASSSSDNSTPKGEPWVWFTSLGLIIGLSMVAGLLGLVLINGFSVFWAPQVPSVKLKDGTEIVGQFVQRRVRSNSPASDPRYERQYQIGLRELNSTSYVWVDELNITDEKFTLETLGLERMENGPAFITPKVIVDSAGKQHVADANTFAIIRAEVDQAAVIRERVLDINQNKIGVVNSEMEATRIALRRAEDRQEPTVELTDKIKSLDLKFAELKKQAEEISKPTAQAHLEGVDAMGRSVTIPFAQIVRAWEPNRMTTMDRVGLLFSRIGEFLFDAPREANTEGGLMPAIFGTLVMTVFMSLLVTPVGVIAAIYLKEYAKDGAVLRVVRICVNNLAGVPSIVFGVFGLGFFVYVLGGTIDHLFFSDQLKYNNNTPVFGTGGLLWCSLTLALMTLPVVIVATEEALSAVPRGMREASLAAGASKWQTIRDILLPASAPGILTGVILAMARGAGEVAPLMIVGVVKLAPTLPVDGLAPFLHLDRKFMHLGFHIYDLGFQSPDSDAARPMVFATTLLLIILVVCLNLGAITIRNRLRARFKGAAF
ncbi:MAG: phosphate ABC transporter permease PstA [Verrucomicrobia bacterium]|nr:phosphate ABC transporter permease PstA [Verrucomicrobiota bacterium]